MKLVGKKTDKTEIDKRSKDVTKNLNNLF